MGEARVASPLTEAAYRAGLPKPWLAVVDGDMMRKLRESLGLSQKELSERAKVGIKIVKRLESLPSGRCMPRTAALLATALDEDHIVLVRLSLLTLAARRGS
ncbi:MAG TPA: helix-turn-helix transcriptional regulator [Streptosporangiaceae bacterium]|nr:helix-turn-helix transcriptional regulator [Streptosporangiaceae bacterium]